ncbi:GDYXXLXY domain-containing protein [Sandaracinobacteroides hominis]|uniref:GDYXXLXY domain-containing protein n=1 Tax=Sandaracinobacteroides hominis TaxID=2780086 RepID=UPI0018F4F648|nr:GDYXXLXY domain-containing protein [Sandaracinobacteroides hominis]
MNRIALIAALLLPFLVLGAGIARNQSALSDAQEWRIPIAGYDPRDPLRGQYVAFTYDWRVAGDPAICDKMQGCDLCLDRDGEQVTATVVSAGSQCAARVDPRLSRMDVRPSFGVGNSQFASRIFVSESSAPALEEQLRTGPMVVVAALTPDGRLVNRAIEPAHR